MYTQFVAFDGQVFTTKALAEAHEDGLFEAWLKEEPQAAHVKALLDPEHVESQEVIIKRLLKYLFLKQQEK